MKIYNKLLFSIIIPIYNVEEYIRQCVDSIISQAYREFELILVDDGSTDLCSEICDKYALTDRRIKVIHKENGGLSDARNAGIHAASGEYLLFIDGDDFIAENSLACIAKALDTNDYPDILFLNALFYYNKNNISQYGNKQVYENIHGKSKDSILKQLSTGGQFHVSACVKIAKRMLIIDKNIFFTKGIIGEDVDFSIKLYLFANTYGYLNYDYYYYRQERTGSIMLRKDGKRFCDLIYILTKWEELSKTEYKENKDWILRFLFHQYYILISLYKRTDNELKTKEVKKIIKRLSYILKYTENKKALFLYIVLKIFGINFTSCLINLYEG